MRVGQLRLKPRLTVETKLRDVRWHGRPKPFAEMEMGVK